MHINGQNKAKRCFPNFWRELLLICKTVHVLIDTNQDVLRKEMSTCSNKHGLYQQTTCPNTPDTQEEAFPRRSYSDRKLDSPLATWVFINASRPKLKGWQRAHRDVVHERFAPRQQLNKKRDPETARQFSRSVWKARDGKNRQIIMQLHINCGFRAIGWKNHMMIVLHTVHLTKWNTALWQVPSETKSRAYLPLQ